MEPVGGLGADGASGTNVALRIEEEAPNNGAAPEVKTVSKSPTKAAIDRLRKDKVAMICLGIFVAFILIALFAPLLAKLEGQNITDDHFDLLNEFDLPTIGTNSQHWFGVEPGTGRDLFARWVYGARPSLLVATSVTILTTIIGVIVGLVAGFSRGWVDKVLSWIMDFFLSLPYLLFAIAVPAVLLSIFVKGGANTSQVATARFYSLIFVLTFFGWAGLARLIRGQVLSLREREFVAAARVLGVPTRKILFKELLPNLVAPIVVSASLSLPGIVAAEATLTFLGVGLIDPTPSWGVTIQAAQNYYRADPLYLWIPVVGVTLLVLVLSLLGDSIRDAFDPKTRH